MSSPQIRFKGPESLSHPDPKTIIMRAKDLPGAHSKFLRGLVLVDIDTWLARGEPYSVLDLPPEPELGQTIVAVGVKGAHRNGKRIMELQEDLENDTNKSFVLVYESEERGWVITTEI